MTKNRGTEVAFMSITCEHYAPSNERHATKLCTRFLIVLWSAPGELAYNQTMKQVRLLGFMLGSLVCMSSVGGSVRTHLPQAQKAETGLSISGDIPASILLKAKDLDAMPQVSAPVVQEDGSTSTYSGVLLRAILEKVGAPIGKLLRGKSMASYVLARARDGYEVMFTLPELDASFGNERVLLVYKQDGKPLFGYEGPFRILCPDDKAGARSIRMLASLEIVRLRK
jgi:hypothetical protein